MAAFPPYNSDIPADVQALLDEEQRRARLAKKAAQEAKEASAHAWILGGWRGRGQTAQERTTQTARTAAAPALLGGPPPKSPDRNR